MMKAVANVLGAVLVLTALIGFVNHSFLAMDLSPMHDAVLLLAGIAGLYFGINGTEFQARNACRVLGGMFTLLGILTLAIGEPGIATAGGVQIQAHDVWRIIPGHLEYTTMDGLRDLCAGIVGLIAGFMPRQKEIEFDMAAQKLDNSVGKQRISSK